LFLLVGFILKNRKMKIYKVYKGSWNWSKAPVVEVEAERITDKSVWVKGSRSSVDSSYEAYFLELAEAKACLIALAMRETAMAQEKLETAREKLTILLESLDKISNTEEPI
jgi:hypothetical protein